MTPDTEALLMAYVYGDLSEDAARAFEAQLDADAELRAEADGMIAIRDLLEDDKSFGLSAGLDVPPAHLRQAIFEQEALERPAEIRQAALQVSAPSPQERMPFVQRLSTWIFGGGTLALGAAAVLFFVQNSDRLEAPDMAARSVASAPVADEEGAAAPAAMAKAEAPGDGKAPQGAFKNEFKEAPEAKKADSADPQIADNLRVNRATGKAAYPTTTKTAERDSRTSLRRKTPAYTDDVAKDASRRQARLLDRAEGEKAAAEPEVQQRARKAKKKAKRKANEPTFDQMASGYARGGSAQAPSGNLGRIADVDDGAYRGGGGGAAKGAGRSGETEQEEAELQTAEVPAQQQWAPQMDNKWSPPPMEAADEDDVDESIADQGFGGAAAADAPQNSQDKSSQDKALREESVAKADVADQKPAKVAKPAPARRPASSSAPASKGPPTPPKAARDYNQKLRSSKKGKRSLSKRDRRRDDEKRKSQRAAQDEQVQQLLATALRELKTGNPASALNIFQQAEVRDRSRHAGVIPVVGQMQALEALKQHQAAMNLLPRVRRAQKNTEGRPEGLEVGARLAETLGNWALAETLYRELMGYKRFKRKAQKGAARSRKKATMRNMDFEAAEAAPAAQKAE